MPSAPDLKFGFIVNNLSKANSWTTEIQSVLVDEDGGERTFLSHECRQENVTLSDQQSAATILQADKPYEFLTYTQGERFYQIGSLDAPTTFFGQQSGPAGGVPTPHGAPDWLSAACCDDRAITELGFAEVLAGLRGRRLAIRELFLRLRFRHAGRRHALYCPSRYVNFANEAIAQTPYLQPISGLVAMPGGESVTFGYIMAAIDPSGTRRVEFAAARYVDLYGWVARREAVPALAAILGNLSRMAPCYARVFDQSAVIEGDVDFYRYD